MSTSIGDRVRESIPADVSQRRLAPEVGMTHDALSRAINGQRHFSAVELAKIAGRLGRDIHWLITGEHDPFRVRLAARHLWAQGSVEQEEDDGKIVQRVVDAYRTAYDDVGHVPSSVAPLPSNPVELRTRLADTDSGSADCIGNVRFLADRIQDVLAVDIVRDPHLQTDYSFRIGEHAVMLLRSTTHWFRANWSIAHELGHLVLGHHVSGHPNAIDEEPANAFAAEFLLPAERIRANDWQHMSRSDFTLWLWNAGVSTAAMRTRFKELGISISQDVHDAIQEPTPKLMRAYVGLIRHQTRSHGDPIWERENATTGRRFPEHVVTTLTERVEAGRADPHLLAWVREVPVDDLYWPEPDIDAPSDEYARLSSRAEQTDWFGLLNG